MMMKKKLLPAEDLRNVAGVLLRIYSKKKRKK